MPGPVLKSSSLVTPRSYRGPDGRIYIDPVISLGYEIPFVNTANVGRIEAGEPVITTLAQNSTVNPLVVSASTAVKDVRIVAQESNAAHIVGQQFFLGVATTDIEIGEPGACAGVGSIVMVKCEDVTVDTGAVVGSYVVVSATEAGAVVSAATGDVVGGVYDGMVVGRILVAAGTSATKTGSNTVCCVFITPF